MENERLQKLKRQKNILLEHLDWINQEIDQEMVEHAPSVSPKASRLAEAVGDNKTVDFSLSDDRSNTEDLSQEQVATDLYSELGPNTKNAAADTKRGCLMVSGIAFCALGAIITYVLVWY